MRGLAILVESASRASSALVSCEDCIACCKHGLVYVLEAERLALQAAAVPLIVIDGVTFIARLSDGSCPMLDRMERKCSIYDQRPLCCRLFPFDLQRANNRLKWVVTDVCPAERRRFAFDEEGSDLGAASISRLASLLDSDLGQTEIKFLEKKEEVSATIELLEDGAARWLELDDAVGRGTPEEIKGGLDGKEGKGQVEEGATEEEV